MKLPFSYKNNFFRNVVVISCVGHGLLFAQAGIWTPKPEYGVVQAPASVEVVLIEVEPKKIPVIEDKVMTAIEPEESAPEVPQIEEKVEKEIPKPEEKPVYIPPIKGAITEQQPTYLKNPAPQYPYRARQRGWEGTVLLRAFISKEGLPEQLEIKQSSGHSVLDNAALEAVRLWQFKPASVGELSFSAWIDIPIRFVLS